MMLIGRHRSVPTSKVDNSIRLPQLAEPESDEKSPASLGMSWAELMRGFTDDGGTVPLEENEEENQRSPRLSDSFIRMPTRD